MASKHMEEIQRKLTLLDYPRANAPAQSLLFAGIERYRLLEWLFFRYAPTRPRRIFLSSCYLGVSISLVDMVLILEFGFETEGLLV